MESVFLYFLQVNLMLSLLYLGYRFLLRNLTFYKMNRFYFIAGICYSFLYPVIEISALFKTDEMASLSGSFSPVLLPLEASVTPGFSLLEVALGVLMLGGLAFGMIVALRLLSVYRVHRNSQRESWKTFAYRQVGYPLHPFAFLTQVYVHKQMYSVDKLETVLTHEHVHVKGWHTLDVLLMEIVWIINWYNPLVWKMRKAVRQNLEYLTDRELLSRGVNRQDYAYALVGLASPKAPCLPGNTFSFKPLKNRIMMMNKNPSGKLHFGKYLFLLPVFIFMGMGITAALAQEKMEELTKKTQGTVWKTDTLETDADSKQLGGEDPLIVVNGKTYERDAIDIIEASAIEKINVLKDDAALEKYGNKGKSGVIEITLKEGEKVPVLADSEGTHGFDRHQDRLFLIDGKESSFKEARKLKPSQIKRMSIMKEPEAVARYGEKAKNGVVKIDLQGGEEKTTAVNQKNPPLYIVDGEKVPADEVNARVDPNQVDSINVLKDKLATDEYGEEGKNGVVLITLKHSEK